MNFGKLIEIDGCDLNQADISHYELSVYNQLLTIGDVLGQYETGILVLTALQKKVTIKPSLMHVYDDQGNEELDILDHPVLDPDRTDLAGQAEADNTSASLKIISTTSHAGLGSTVTLRYSPDVWWYTDAARTGFDAEKHRYVQINNESKPISSSKAWQPDDILLHELVHAVRQTMGLWLDPKTHPLDRYYTSLEEFFAVMVANIYVSERDTVANPRALRGTNVVKKDGTDPLFKEFSKDDLKKVHPELEFDQTDDEAFYACYGTTIDDLCTEMPVFTSKLAAVEAHFNPLAIRRREMARAAEKARKAANPTAEESLMKKFGVPHEPKGKKK